MADKTDIWVYADWKGMVSPKCIGILSAQQAKGRKAFSFSYDTDWISSQEQLLLDPDYGAKLIESNEDTIEVKKWLAMLMAPGSSLGGARPKANILDENGHPWIAKFPSKNDTIDKGEWEYLAYRLAVDAGIDMAESRLEHIAGPYHTFFYYLAGNLHGQMFNTF